MVEDIGWLQGRRWWRTEGGRKEDDGGGQRGGCKDDDGGGQRVGARKTMVEVRGWSLQG